MKIMRKQLRKLIKESLEKIWVDRTAAEPNAWNREMKQVKNMISSVRKNIFLKNRNSCKFCPFLDTEHCT